MKSILLLVVDCLRADRLDRPHREWPAASALAERGARFENAYTTCPTTTPAFTAMFTGRLPTNHGVRSLRGARLSADVPTLAEELARGGWKTWASVTGPLLDNVGHLRGFADVEYRDVPDRSVHGGWGERALERIRGGAEGDASWFGVVHLWDLHTPRTYPRSFDSRRYGRTAYDRALGGLDVWLGRAVAAAGENTLVVLTGDHGENVNLEPRSLRQQGVARRIRQRLPVEEWATKAVERGTRSESKRLLRLAPRYFWNHNQTLFEGDIRVPLVFAGPEARAGGRATPVSHVDLAPTLLELAGLSASARGWDGTSLAASVREGAEPPAHPVVAEVPTGDLSGVSTISQHAIRDGSWKLVTSLDDESVADALYDLAADPRERRNLASAHPEVVERLKARLRELTTERTDAAEMSEEDDAILAERLEELGYL